MFDTMISPPIFDRKDLAQRYHCSLRTIDRRAAGGKLPDSFRLPGKMWRSKDIERMEKAGLR